MTIDIENMTAESILADSTFTELLNIKDEVVKTKTQMNLEEKADSLKVKDKFTKLLSAHKANQKKLSRSKARIGRSDKPEELDETPEGLPNLGKWHSYSDGEPTGVIDAILVDYIIRKYHMFVIAKMPYIYEDGVYRLDDNETRLKEIIQGLIFERLVTINVLNRVYQLIIATHSLQRSYEDLNNYHKHWINFKNGFFDPIKWVMIPHDPKYLSINQIPHIFKLEANPVGAATKSFIEFAIPDESDRQMLWEYYGYCMTTDSSLQKFLIFKGQGGTGKSRLIDIINTMIGYENSSSISLQQLNERFFPYMLLGKLLNSCADIPSKAMDAVDGIKKATGEDKIIAERKTKDAFPFNSYAKLVFSANEIPINIEEKSEALYRRMMIIKVDRKPETKNRNLKDQLIEEIDYSIMQSCKALHVMYERGGFSESSNSKNSVEELYMEADSVTAFLVERTQKADGKLVKSSELYEEYTKYCESLGRTKISVHSFHKNMKNKGYEKKRLSDGEKYAGIVILDENALEADENGFVKVDSSDDNPWKVQ